MQQCDNFAKYNNIESKLDNYMNQLKTEFGNCQLIIAKDEMNLDCLKKLDNKIQSLKCLKVFSEKLNKIKI